MKTAIEIAMDLIKRSEGCELKAYKHEGDVPTIGYGHTHGVFMGMEISQSQAEDYLEWDLQHAADGVLKYTEVPLTVNQLAALIDFTFNEGVGRYQSSSARMLINRGDYEGGAQALLKYVYCAGRVLPGLVKRRQAEYQLFMS